MAKSNFDKYLGKQLESKDFAERFEHASKQWDVALQIAKHREKARLSQKQLAERIGTSQQQISRLERPNYRGSVSTLCRVADALDLQVEIRLVERRAKAGKRLARKRTSSALKKEPSKRG